MCLFSRTARFALPLLCLTLFPVSCADGPQGGSPLKYSGDPVADFVTALRVGDTGKVERLIDSDPSLLKLTDEQGQTAMHYAALGNQPRVIALLKDKGMDLNARDFEGRTPLTVLEASGFRYEEARDALLKMGAQR